MSKILTKVLTAVIALPFLVFIGLLGAATFVVCMLFSPFIERA